MGQKSYKIYKNTKVRELLKKYPESAKILYKLGFDCLTCKGADEEPLRLAAISHGYDPDEFVDLLKRELGKRKGKR